MSPTRKAVKDLLKRNWTVLEISRELRISPTAVYKHKNALEGRVTKKAKVSA